MKEVVLDNFLDKNLRMIILFIGLMSILGFLGALNSYVSLNSIILLIVYLVLSVLCFVLFKLKKALVVENGNLFNSLVFFNKVLVKKEIDTNIYVTGTVKRLDKSTGSWPIFGPIIGLLKEYNGFTIVIQDKNKSNNVNLISLTDLERVNLVIEFIHRNSTITFSKSKYKNHW